MNWINFNPYRLHELTGVKSVADADLLDVFPRACAEIDRLQGEYTSSIRVTVPKDLADMYMKYRPTPLQELPAFAAALHFNGRIFCKREDLTPSGSHKFNAALAEAYFSAKEGVDELVAHTGAGQWGLAVAIACRLVGIRATVFMTRSSFEDKHERVSLIRMLGGNVIPSPSQQTVTGRLRAHSEPEGSLSVALSEAVEWCRENRRAKIAQGCLSYHASFFQSIIGAEVLDQFDEIGVSPSALIAPAGGGTNFLGFVSAYLVARDGKESPQLIAAEASEVPVLSAGHLVLESPDWADHLPASYVYSLGKHDRMASIEANGLRSHARSSVLSLLKRDGIITPLCVHQTDAFAAARLLYETEGILVAPETATGVGAVAQLALKDQATKDSRTFAFNISGSGLLDLRSYERVLLPDSKSTTKDVAA